MDEPPLRPRRTEGASVSAESSLSSSNDVEAQHEPPANQETTGATKQVELIKIKQQAQPVLSDQRWADSKRVLDPSGSLYYHWSMVVSFAFLYNFWSLSYRFAFKEIDFDSVAFWFVLDYSADLVYILDVVVNFHTGYLEDGVLQRRTEKIGQHYRECTLFYLDCFCLLPLDILYLSIGFNSILRCTRLVKIYKFWSYVDRTERHTNYPNVFRTFTLLHYILVILHWNACIFHMILKNKIIDIENLYKISENPCDDISCQYLHAFYWSTLALTTVGNLPKPRTNGEYFYVIVELFFGLFLFASVLGHVSNIVTNVSAARKEFQAKLDAVKTFMRMRRVSDELQNKVIRWFDYLWISQKSSDEDKSVACLPDRLKAEIAIHVHLDTLKRVDIFQNTEAGFLCELVLRLKPVLFSPGDYVCRKNEVGHEMYIVSRGILEVVTNEGKTVVATLKAGSYFGEISVLNVGLAGNKRTASVRSVGYSDLFCLNKHDLWDVLKNYPNAEMRIRARAEERLSKLKGNVTGALAGGDGGNNGGNTRNGTRQANDNLHHYHRHQHPHHHQQPHNRSGAKRESSFVDTNGSSLPGHRRRVCSPGSQAHHYSQTRQTTRQQSRRCQADLGDGCDLCFPSAADNRRQLARSSSSYQHHLDLNDSASFYGAPSSTHCRQLAATNRASRPKFRSSFNSCRQFPARQQQQAMRMQNFQTPSSNLVDHMGGSGGGVDGVMTGRSPSSGGQADTHIDRHHTGGDISYDDDLYDYDDRDDECINRTGSAESAISPPPPILPAAKTLAPTSQLGSMEADDPNRRLSSGSVDSSVNQPQNQRRRPKKRIKCRHGDRRKCYRCCDQSPSLDTQERTHSTRPTSSRCGPRAPQIFQVPVFATTTADNRIQMLQPILTTGGCSQSTSMTQLSALPRPSTIEATTIRIPIQQPLAQLDSTSLLLHNGPQPRASSSLQIGDTRQIGGLSRSIHSNNSSNKPNDEAQ